ncbi:MAG: outer membrane protein transport protein [Desulfobacterales bacterium]|nr:MAG: outer membrane protein transport protein [Desulfobacterales bacterium]
MRRNFPLTPIMLTIVASLLLQPFHASAGGFLLFEQGVKGLGNAFAGGGAVAEDASTIFFNPAGLTRLPGSQIALAGYYILPQAEYNNHSATVSPALPVVGGTPLSGGDGGDAGESAFLANFYYAQEITQKFHAGLGVTVPFGLGTDYDRDWVGRYHGVKSELHTIDINPSVAYRVNKWLSLGGGISAQYAEAKLTNAVDFGTIGFIGGAGTLPQSLDGFTKLKADDWGWRWNVGILVEPTDNLRIGLAYRSNIDYTLKGDAKFEIPAGAEAIARGAGLANTDVKSDVTFPGHASLSAYWRIHDKFAVMGDIFWTNWSEMNELFIELDTGRNVVTTLDWEDTFRFALGGSYYPNQNWTWRAGIAYDQTPVPNDELRTPRIPDNDRIWATVGLSYTFSKSFGIDIAYAHVFVDDPKIRKSGTETEDIPRGALNGDYDASVNIFSAQVNFLF